MYSDRTRIKSLGMVSEKLCRNTLKEGVQYDVHISQIFYRRSRRLARSSQVKTNHFLLATQGLYVVTKWRECFDLRASFVAIKLTLIWSFSPALPHYDVGIIDSMLRCVCSVIDHRWRQNVIKKKRGHMSRRQMCHRMTYTYCLTVHVRGFGLV